jgi:hypothetical protein
MGGVARPGLTLAALGGGRYLASRIRGRVVEHLTPRQVGERYVELVNAGDLKAIVDLFADDGMVEPPNPAYARRIEGIDAIRAHYGNSVGRRKPHITPTHWYVEGNVCVVELESEVNDSTEPMGVVDVFECTPEGKIVRLTAYRR